LSSSFLFQPPPTPVSYPLSLHDALPICSQHVDQHGARQLAALGNGENVRQPLLGVLEVFDRHGEDETRPGSVLHVARRASAASRSEEHTSELQSRSDLVCRLLLEKKNV